MANSLYLCMYVCSDTSSTCLSRMRKRDGKDRHDVHVICTVAVSVALVENQYLSRWDEIY